MREKRILTILFVTLLLDVIGIGILIPLVPALFTDNTAPTFMLTGYSIGEQYFIAGLMTALFGIMQFLAAPLLGDLSDTYGRKKLLTLGVGVLAVAQLLFAAGIAIVSLPLLFISRLVAGVAGANFSIVQATIADVTEPKHRARNFGLIGGAFGLGFILGPLIGGYIVALTGNPALPFLFAGLLGVVNLVFITFMLPETHHVRTVAGKFSVFKAFHNIKIAYLDVDTRPLYTVSFLQMLGFGIHTSFSAVFLEYRYGFSEADTGTYFATVGVCIVLSQIFVVRFANARYSERAILRFAFPLLALSLFAQMVVFNVWLLYALIPFMSAAMSLITTNLPALISKGVSANRQGAALGINGSFQALSQGIAPLLGSGIAAVLGIPIIYVMAGGLVLFAYVLFPKTT
ncbi:TCR/Tet family MFS transporter [Candidatus Parcubacteria bacterium]|nr:TCR/Tet family MFS transporter [Candidatus Parcubacteria bacterium]